MVMCDHKSKEIILQTQTRTPEIVIMWVLTVSAWIAARVFGPLVAFLLDLCALILAILLTFSGNRAGKINGFAKIALEVICFFGYLYVTAMMNRWLIDTFPEAH